MNKNKLRIGIVGCGALTRIFYLPVFKKLSLMPDAVFDPYAGDIADLAKNYNIRSIASSLEDFGERIDMAIVASPNFLHAPQTKYLLEKGKHVLVEKPIATSENDVREMIDACNKSRVVLQPAMMRRFWKINKAIKKMLEEEVLGTLQTVSMREGGVLNWPVQSPALFDPKQSLGGVFIDTGSHTLDLLCWWVNDNNFSVEYEDDNHGGVEADCKLAVEFIETGIKAEVTLSRVRNMPNEFVLKGSRGWIKLKPYGNIFETSDRSIGKYVHNIYSTAELKQQTFDDLFTEQVQSWLKSAKNQTSPVIDAGSVQPSIRMIEQAYYQRKQLVYEWE